jgi:ABC-2 type transport system ATP-binding protein
MISIRDLSVSYGRVRALDGLSLEIPGCGVFGLLGRNGAGKTTTIRSILGIVRRDSGEVLVSGSDPSGDPSVRLGISVLFSEDGLVPALTVIDNLVVWAGLFGFGRRRSVEMAEAVLSRMEASDLSGQSVRDLSTGNRRIAALARTFMRDADLYILDEPTASLDPVRASEVRETIRMLAGTSPVILSTHNLHEAEELCGEVAVIDSGRLVMTGRPGEIGDEGGRFLVRCEAYPLLFRGERFEQGADGSVVLESAEPAAEVLARLLAEGNRVVEFRQLKRSLSDVFLGLMTGGDRR